MKKIVKTIVLAIAMLCTATTASAQLGDSENAIGFNLGYGIGNHEFSNFGIGVRYCRNLSEALRLDFNGMYYFKSGAGDRSHFLNSNRYTDGSYTSGKSTDWIEANINGHYLFNVAEKVYVYPIFGFTTMWGNTKFSVKDLNLSESDYATIANYGEGGEQFVKDAQDAVKNSKNYSDNHFRFGVNLGFGGQYNITDDFGVTLEAQYKLVNSTNKFGHFGISLGCAVLF